jgi:hypothetical protein
MAQAGRDSHGALTWCSLGCWDRGGARPFRRRDWGVAQKLADSLVRDAEKRGGFPKRVPARERLRGYGGQVLPEFPGRLGLRAGGLSLADEVADAVGQDVFDRGVEDARFDARGLFWGPSSGRCQARG